VQFENLEKSGKVKNRKNGKNGAKIFFRKLALAVFASLTLHRQPHAKKWATPFFGFAHPPPLRRRTQKMQYKY
jgi:hypothetical protein